MKSLAFILIMLFFVNSYATELANVQSFSNKVMKLLRNQDSVNFKELPVFPGNEISNDAVIYLFGSGTKEGVAGFLNKENILKKYYGPYKTADSSGYNNYTIVYYDNTRITPNDDGFFNTSEIQEKWGEGYLETVVIVKDEVVSFHRTPFYYGSHAPWGDDY